jgi:4-alpha-glucanotransferase
MNVPRAFNPRAGSHAAGQSWWQALPEGLNGDGGSPHDLSSFARDEALISPDLLIEDELLQKSYCQGQSVPAASIGYDDVIPFKHRLLEISWANYSAGARQDLKAEFEQFRHEQSHWLEDYALFRALKAKFGGTHYLKWPAALAQREPLTLEQVRRELAGEIEERCFAQFLLFRYGRRLKEYAHARGVRLIGDLPFFVSPDSSDVWANPANFLLDETRRPRFVAGVPPNHCSSTGQFWGNPVYDWDALRESGYRWCLHRFRAMLEQVDIIRLNHFRGFAAAWHVSPSAPTAQCGQWVAGPGPAFFAAVQGEFGSMPFIAEDLGMITADVWKLLDLIGVPGMRVLQSAFDGHSDNPHLPDNYSTETVAYTATHDGPSTRGWYANLSSHERGELWAYLKRGGGDVVEGASVEVAPALMRLEWSSVAALAMVPVQDVLNLGPDAHIAAPGVPTRNGHWRATTDMLHAPAFEYLRQLTKVTKRLGAS